ncbi:50S ribosomal protein L11 [Candidatus Nomurabacteria bacterium]|uniref:Large ribosomal subunit protein uL11 n=1 Tax=Candidatus Dojkabacteria bacterium TaxID=2099670 RepID=A0A955HZN5_9BACT|nr:50S ribosomal protein L11 [Candidatus Dojkabacteria bacterium]MCB9789742.1 50S ribosomal protein L11 [Candidatus Nomurabacteria bacterium]MCB9803839.1 50S ribosomal protein L11 [Candidatus Nomurabacteria bacterium]
MAEKKIVKQKMKLVIPAGQASLAPPIGPALSPTGINTNDFVQKFNEKTAEGQGILTPVIITIFEDRSFTLEFKTPPTSELIRRELKIKKGSPIPNIKKVGKLSKAQILKIVEIKMPDLNTTDEKQAYNTIAGTAKQMGIEVEAYE